MPSAFVADTHIITCWLAEPRLLSDNQRRRLEQAESHEQHLFLSGISLSEIAFLSTDQRARAAKITSAMLDMLDGHPLVRILPISVEIARDVAAIRHALRDPMDCIIVATARMHGMPLMTSDQRIIDSGLVPVIE